MEQKTTVLGIAFDLDGVLIDSAPCHRAAFREVFAPLGVKEFDYSPYPGWRTTEVVRDMLERLGRAADEETVGRLAEAKSRLAREMVAERQPLAEGFPEVLQRLLPTHRLALATSGSRSSVESFFAFSGTRPLFRSVLCGDDVTFAKPHPEIYSRTRDLLGVPLSEGKESRYFVVEDAIAGVQAGLAAHAIVIGIAGTCTARALRDAGAHHVIDSLHELPEVVS